MKFSGGGGFSTQTKYITRARLDPICLPPEPTLTIRLHCQPSRRNALERIRTAPHGKAERVATPVGEGIWDRSCSRWSTNYNFGGGGGGGAQTESPFGWERRGHVQDRQVLQGDLVGRITGEKVTGWSCAHLRPIKDRISTTGLPKF